LTAANTPSRWPRAISSGSLPSVQIAVISGRTPCLAATRPRSALDRRGPRRRWSPAALGSASRRSRELPARYAATPSPSSRRRADARANRRTADRDRFHAGGSRDAHMRPREEDRARRRLLLRSAPRRTEGLMTGCIVGWAHSKFGRHDDRDVESLIVEVAQGALADAGIPGADIDAVFSAR